MNDIIFTPEIHLAYLTALTALKEGNTLAYFEQLKILYELHAKHERSNAIALSDFLAQLARLHEPELRTLSDEIAAHYQAIHATLRSFPIVGAAILEMIQKENRSERVEGYLRNYLFLTPSLDPGSSVSEDDIIFIAAQRYIGKIIKAGEVNRLFLPNLLHKKVDSREQQPGDREIAAIAIIAFGDVPADEIHLKKLNELIEEHWLKCIAALNENNMHDFYGSLANLAKAIVHQLIASDKNPSGDAIQESFQQLHKKMEIDSRNFASRLNERGFDIYKTLFKEHSHLFNELFSSPIEDNHEEEVSRRKKSAANSFFFLLLPAPNDFLEEMPNKEKIHRAIDIEFDSREFELQCIQQEERIVRAKLACLLALKNCLESEKAAWKLEGKTLAGFMFPLLSRCFPSFGHKTPDGIKKLRKIVNDKNSKGTEDEYERIKSLLFSKSKKGFGRSQKTKDFYSSWIRNIRNAECGITPKLVA